MGSKFKNLLKEYWFVPLSAFIVLGIILSGYKICFVIGSSMEPTLYNKEQLLIKTKKMDIQRYDIITFNNEVEGPLIKRIIGLPGETIKAVGNDIYINGEKIEDPVNVKVNDFGCLIDGVTLGPDEYFAMGDNRNNSLDCRILGPLKEEQITGKILYKLYNFEKIQ